METYWSQEERSTATSDWHMSKNLKYMYVVCKWILARLEQFHKFTSHTGKRHGKLARKKISNLAGPTTY